MATIQPVYRLNTVPWTLTAGAAIVGGEVLIVSAANTVTKSAGASVAAIGIAATDAASGANVLVYPLEGVFEVTAAGAIAAGALVTSAAAGKVDTLGGGAKDLAIGIALTVASADGDTIRVKFFR
jgi:hypothetical protein